ncbi:MAG: hypothetical protein E4G98_04985 [Promethearchaeota archaeon]|nr:MAG: hypothetical protein E4G98_04985 [Candidatus Lokiarchaeota archaeon]
MQQKNRLMIITGSIFLLMLMPLMVAAQTSNILGIERGDIFMYDISDDPYNPSIQVTILKIEESDISAEVKISIEETHNLEIQGIGSKTIIINESSSEYSTNDIVVMTTDLLVLNGGFFIPRSQAPVTLEVALIEDNIYYTLISDENGVLTSARIIHSNDMITFTLTHKSHRDGTPLQWYLRDNWAILSVVALGIIILVGVRVIRRQKDKHKLKVSP